MKKKVTISRLLARLVMFAILGVAIGGCKTTKPLVSENTSDRLIERETVDSLIGVAVIAHALILPLLATAWGTCILQRLTHCKASVLD